LHIDIRKTAVFDKHFYFAKNLKKTTIFTVQITKSYLIPQEN